MIHIRCLDDSQTAILDRVEEPSEDPGKDPHSTDEEDRGPCNDGDDEDEESEDDAE